MGNIVWSSLFFGNFSVAYMSDHITIDNITVSGVKITETHSSNPHCFKSTLSFSGPNLQYLNGNLLTCENSLGDSLEVAILGEKNELWI